MIFKRCQICICFNWNCIYYLITISCNFSNTLLRSDRYSIGNVYNFVMAKKYLKSLLILCFKKGLPTMSKIWVSHKLIALRTRSLMYQILLIALGHLQIISSSHENVWVRAVIVQIYVLATTAERTHTRNYLIVCKWY